MSKNYSKISNQRYLWLIVTKFLNNICKTKSVNIFFSLELSSKLMKRYMNSEMYKWSSWPSHHTIRRQPPIFQFFFIFFHHFCLQKPHHSCGHCFPYDQIDHPKIIRQPPIIQFFYSFMIFVYRNPITDADTFFPWTAVWYTWRRSLSGYAACLSWFFHEWLYILSCFSLSGRMRGVWVWKKEYAFSFSCNFHPIFISFF